MRNKIFKPNAIKFLTVTKLWLFALILVASGAWPLLQSYAQSNGASLFVTPATASAEQDKTFQVAVRVNTGGQEINAVEAHLSYVAEDFEFVEISGANSDFSIQAEHSGGNGQVKIARGNFPAVSGNNKLVATVIFKAKQGSGSTSLNFTQDSVVIRSSDNQDILNNTTGGTYTLTASPAQVPPPESGSSPAPSQPSSPPSSTAPGTTAPETGEPDGGPQTGTEAPAARNVIEEIRLRHHEFTRLSFRISSSHPVRVFLKYGLDSGLHLSTPQSGLGRTHDIVLDEAFLIPGATYHYQVVATTADGTVEESEIHTVTTKGYTVIITVTDRHGQPLADLPVKLYSEPKESTTDGNGQVAFKDVSPGRHEIAANLNGREVRQTITVADDMREEEGVQVADPQMMTVALDTRSPLVILLAVLITAFLLVTLGGGGWWLWRRRQTDDSPFTPAVPEPSRDQSAVVAPQTIQPSKPTTETVAPTVSNSENNNQGNIVWPGQGQNNISTKHNDQI